jgi:hypothetical protein
LHSLSVGRWVTELVLAVIPSEVGSWSRINSTKLAFSIACRSEPEELDVIGGSCPGLDSADKDSSTFVLLHEHEVVSLE